MKGNVNPTSLPEKTNYGSHVLEYRDLREISQGGPEVGELAIDGSPVVSGALHGGPPFCKGAYAYVPRLVSKILGVGFVIDRIDLTTKQIVQIGPLRRLIWIRDVTDEKIVFFTNIDQSSTETVPLPN